MTRDHDFTCQPGPRAGRGAKGKPMDPKNVPNEEPKPGKRPAPRPGLPVSDEEYERMKEDAKHRRAPDDAPAQED